MATKAPGQSSKDSSRQSSGPSSPASSPSTQTGSAPAGKSYDPRQDGAMGVSSDPRGDSLAPEFNPAQRSLKAKEAAGASLYNPNDSSGAVSPASSNPSSPEDLAEAEANEGYYNPSDGKQRKKGAGGFFGQNKRGLAIGGSVVGGGIIGIIVSMLMLLPLKIENMIQNLTSNFYGNLTSATVDQSTKMVSHYLERYVLPAYKDCGTIIDERCKVNITGPGNPVKNTYKAWSKAKLERQLAKEGISLSYDTKSENWILRIDNDKGTKVGKNGEQIVAEFDGTRKGKRDAKRYLKIKQKTDTSMNTIAKYRAVMTRFKIGRLGTQLFPTKRCVVRCHLSKYVDGKITDAFKSKFNYEKETKDPKRLAQLYIIERVLQPRAELTGTALLCILDEGCRPDKTEATPCQEGVDCADGGMPRDEYDMAQRAKMEELAKKLGIEDAAKLAEINRIYSEMQQRGFREYAMKAVLSKFMGQEAADLATKRVSAAIPYVGWVNLAAKMVNQANTAGPKIKKISYGLSAAAAVKMFMTYQSYADEIHTGNISADEVGSWTDTLGTTTDTDKNPSQGGTAGAEGSPLYQNLIEGAGKNTSPQLSSSASILSQVLPAKAYAAAADAKDPYTDYRCEDDNNKAPPKGQLVCQNELLGQGIGVFNTIHNYFTNGPGIVVKTIADVWNGTIGKIFDLIDKVSGWPGNAIMGASQTALEKLCGTVAQAGLGPLSSICGVKKVIDDEAPKVLNAAANEFFPNPTGANMSGARTFNVMAAGANVLGNDSCAAAGCMNVSDQVAAKIQKEQSDFERYSFQQKPLFARLFDTNDRFSLISRLAMAVPFDLNASISRNFSKIVSNPFGSLAHGFASAVPFKNASAADYSTVNVFHIGNMAFPRDKLPDDPEKYWDEHNCGDTSENGPIFKWQQKSADDPVNEDTGMPMHNSVEPCLLIKYVTGVDAGYIDPSLLTKDDLAETSLANGAQAAVDATNPADSVSSDEKAVAKEILANKKISYLYSAKDDVMLAAQGKKGTNGVPIDIRGLQIVAALGRNHSVIVSAYESYGGGHHAGSDHYDGHAVDIAQIDGKTAFINITDFWDEIKPYSKNAIFLQGDCAGAKPAPSGMNRRPGDDCSHQHISLK